MLSTRSPPKQAASVEAFTVLRRTTKPGSPSDHQQSYTQTRPNGLEFTKKKYTHKLRWRLRSLVKRSIGDEKRAQTPGETLDLGLDFPLLGDDFLVHWWLELVYPGRPGEESDCWTCAKNNLELKLSIRASP